MAEEKDRIGILLEEYKNQNEWQRHNENQRAQLASILLAICAALVTLLPKDKPLTHNDWPIPALLTIIGIFGILAVMKYWERWVHHARLVTAHRNLLDSYFDNNLLTKTRKDTNREHDKGWRPLFKDRHLMQHWLWEGIFALITLLGIYFLARTFALI